MEHRRNILVTSGAGYIGSHACQALPLGWVFPHLQEVYGRPGRRNELYLGQGEAIAAERRNDHNG